jgi:hypothetical protein
VSIRLRNNHIRRNIEFGSLLQISYCRLASVSSTIRFNCVKYTCWYITCNTQVTVKQLHMPVLSDHFIVYYLCQIKHCRRTIQTKHMDDAFLLNTASSQTSISFESYCFNHSLRRLSRESEAN